MVPPTNFKVTNQVHGRSSGPVLARRPVTGSQDATLRASLFSITTAISLTEIQSWRTCNRTTTTALRQPQMRQVICVCRIDLAYDETV